MIKKKPRARTTVTVFFGVLSISFLVLAVSSLVLLRSNQESLQQHSYDETGLAALQIRLHYEILLGNLAALEKKPLQDDFAKAVDAFDILYERIKSIPNRPTYAKLLDEETLAIRQDLLVSLATQLDRIDAAADGDGAQLSGLYERLLPLRRKIERLGHRPVQIASERRAEATRKNKRQTTLFSWVVFGFIVSGFVFAAVIMRQLKHMHGMSRKLRISRDEAEAASAAKSDFLSHMSHEFRTPMNAILGFAQLLNMGELKDNQKQAVKQILMSGDTMLGLVDQVLELDNIILGKVVLSPGNVDHAALLVECRNMVSDQAKIHEVRVNIVSVDDALPKIIVTDYMRLQQVLFCFLSNAINYNRKDGEVFLASEKVSNTEIQFSIRDTGLGIPLDRQEGLFQPFNRLGRESQSIQGTGVGLTIAHELVKLLHGSIRFESVPGQGSTFWITIPFDWDTA